MSTEWEPCDSCSSRIECTVKGCVKQSPAQPCRSPYCECEVGRCTHPGFFDARGTPQPAAQPEQPEPGELADEPHVNIRVWLANKAQAVKFGAVGFEASRIKRETITELLVDWCNEFGTVVRTNTRKRTAEQNARIMEAVQFYGDQRAIDAYCRGFNEPDDPSGKTLAALSEVARLLKGQV